MEGIRSLSADKPLTDPQEDQLGYARFARHLATTLIKMVPAEGFVVAIYGPWGSGKTTLLNFLFHYFKQFPLDEQPLIVPFNPWWFSGHEKLTKHFFDQFQACLASADFPMTSLEKKVAEFADLVSELPASIHIPYIAIGNVSVEFTPMKPAIKNVVKLKMEIAEELRKQSRRIFVTVDDIDRLNPEEVRQLFGVIKSIADFPNIVYLLTFDKRVVIDALRETQGIPGESYLEKIVQSPFELPLPDRSSLYRLLLGNLETIMTGTPEELFDQTYWASVFLKGVEHFISTPRKINLLTNTLSVTYSAVRGEVNPVDFIAIETLRIFCTEAYNMVRTYPEKFTGRELVTSKIDQLRIFHESWITQVAEEDREAAKGLLTRLFPKLENVWEDLGFDRPLEAAWRKQLRICSPDIFPIYFHLALPQGTISNAEIMAALSLVDQPEAFSARLIDLAAQIRPDGRNRLNPFLERLLDYTDKEIIPDSIPPILRSLFDVGDQLLHLDDEFSGKLPIGNDQRLAQIIWQLLQRLPPEARTGALREAIAPGRAIFISARIVTQLRKNESRQFREEPSQAIKPAQASKPARRSDQESLEALVLAKVRDAAQDGLLLACPKLADFLSMWKDLAGEAEPKAWMMKVAGDDRNLAQLLQKFLEKDFNHMTVKMDGGHRYHLNHKALKAFLNPDSIVDRARTLTGSDWLSDLQQEALRQFLEAYGPHRH
jgi:predicted KAP-like P-loop ATPase